MTLFSSFLGTFCQFSNFVSKFGTHKYRSWMNNDVVRDISNQIGIEVAVKYQRDFSNPIEKKYLFAYQIKITNHSEHIVQLTSRKWFIFDSSGKQTLVNGEGVVGKTPILQKGESFKYVSCCPLESPIGYMHGEYEFELVGYDETFSAVIPQFQLTCPDILN